MQQDTPRYRTLVAALERRWGSNVARLFERAWRSDSLLDCPTFGEWLVAMPEHPVAQAFSLSTAATETAEAQASTSPEEVTLGIVRGLMQAARRMEDKGNLENALELYRQALELAQADPSLRSLAREIELTVQDVEKRMAAQASPLQPAISPRPVEEGPGGRVISPLSPGEGPGVRAEPRRKPGWRFWLLWVLVHTLIAVMVVEMVPSTPVESIFEWRVTETVGVDVHFAWAAIATGAIIGGVLGLIEWLFLRLYLQKVGWWILATIASGIIGNLFFFGFSNYGGSITSWMEIMLLLLETIRGGVSLVPKWLVLHKRVRKAVWWIASIVGANILFQPLYTFLFHLIANMVLSTAVNTAISNTITGAVLVWLLRQPRPETKGDAQ
jgi:hypothetical protein